MTISGAAFDVILMQHRNNSQAKMSDIWIDS
jgi:hypothetical protein